MPEAHVAWPTELKVQDGGRILKVSFEDDLVFELPAELLRVMSPSAEVQGHSRRERKIVAGKRDVAIRAVEPIGSYAVKLGFDDGHDTGIFTWAYLHEMGCALGAKWAAYESELASAGLERDRPGQGPASINGHAIKQA